MTRDLDTTWAAPDHRTTVERITDELGRLHEGELLEVFKQAARLMDEDHRDEGGGMRVRFESSDTPFMDGSHCHIVDPYMGVPPQEGDQVTLFAVDRNGPIRECIGIGHYVQGEDYPYELCVYLGETDQ